MLVLPHIMAMQLCCCPLHSTVNSDVGARRIYLLVGRKGYVYSMLVSLWTGNI